MSQIYKNNSSGGGAGITQVLGQASLVAPTTTVTTVGTVATVENRAWETQYVVDPSATQGLRGTYQTIQAAINQAVTDGATLGTYKKIYIRVGSYVENLTIPGGIILVGQVLSQPAGGVVTPYQATVVSGNHTFTGNAVGGFEQVNFVTTSGDIFTGGAIVLWYMDNCYFAQATPTDNVFNITAANSYLSFLDCTLGGNQLMTTSDVEIYMNNCLFQNSGVVNVTNGNDATFINCTNIGEIATTGGTINAYSCTFFSNTSTFNISGNATGIIKDCMFTGPIIGVQNTITAKLINCSSTFGSAVYQTGINYLNAQIMQGSIIYGKDVTVGDGSPYGITIFDHYVGVNNTFNPGVVTLPNTNVNQGQTFIVKDITGNAATNNIQIDVAGGLLIDGAANQTINQNYGSITVRFDGTNYFTI